MNRNKNGCANTRAQQWHYRNLSSTVLPAILICFGLRLLLFLLIAPPPSQMPPPGTPFTHTIFPQAAWKKRSAVLQLKRAFVSLSILRRSKGKTAQALKGSFSVQAGLNQLLTGSGLEAIRQAKGHVVKKSALMATNTGHGTAADPPTTLAPIKVSASSITGPTDGYVATKSFSATRTNTPLRDVPQSITVERRI